MKLRIFDSRLFSGSISSLARPPRGQISFLDGLRTIAVLLVMNHHLSMLFGTEFGPNPYSRSMLVIHGWMGVDLFFILSGFFIGGQLWKELQKTGTVKVGRFILRRGFRIWPLYFFTFACVFIAKIVSAHGLTAEAFGWTDLIFVTNYYSHGIVLGGWSLCSEEQFYIAVPTLLFFLAPFAPKLRTYRPWLWLLLLMVPLYRAVIWLHVTGHLIAHSQLMWPRIYYPLLTHCDGLIMGLILSNLWTCAGQQQSKKVSPLLLALGAILLGGALYLIDGEVFAFSALALVFGSTAWLGLQYRLSLFDSRIFYWLSRLSFGMYLNHQYLCPWVVQSMLPRIPLLPRVPILLNLAGVAILTALSAAVSLVTFCCVEHPFLRMRAIVLER
ncbi:MAG: acyltransferase family protein [Terracidiphilus sp.]